MKPSNRLKKKRQWIHFCHFQQQTYQRHLFASSLQSIYLYFTYWIIGFSSSYFSVCNIQYVLVLVKLLFIWKMFLLWFIFISILILSHLPQQSVLTYFPLICFSTTFDIHVKAVSVYILVIYFAFQSYTYSYTRMHAFCKSIYMYVCNVTRFL